MIETKSLTHTIRLFAERLSWLDLFWPVLYCSYRGDKSRIPSYYSVIKGHSCVTDLTLSLEGILKTMKSNTRNEIRRAEREGCVFGVVEDVAEFIPFYNEFCKSKGYHDYVSETRLKKFQCILVTKVTCKGIVLAMHVTQLDPNGGMSLLILSGSMRLNESVDQKLVGWANRYLHFKDLEWLKAHGYKAYDWSGVCVDPSDPRYSIGQFKLSFGGVLVESWSIKSPLFVVAETVKLLVRKMMHR